MARGMRRAIRRLATDETRQLRARIDHLETSLEALQDSVYHDVQRHDRELAELRRLVDPVNLVRALSDDARRRGL
jgi:hypothetical protein